MKLYLLRKLTAFGYPPLIIRNLIENIENLSLEQAIEML